MRNTTTTGISSRTRRPTTTPVTPYMSRPTTTGLLTFSKLNATKTATQNNIHKEFKALLKSKRKTKLVGIGRRPHDRTLFDCLQEYPQDGMNGRLVNLNEFMDVTSSAAKTSSSEKAAEVEESSMIALSSLSATIATTAVANDQVEGERNDDDDDAGAADKEEEQQEVAVDEIKEEMEVQTSGSIDYCVGENGTIIILDDRDDSCYGDDKYFYRGDEVNSLLDVVANTSALEKNHDLALREIDLDCSSSMSDDEIDSLVKFCGWGEAMNLMTITC